jgi:ATP phosphoribosyltransferase
MPPAPASSTGSAEIAGKRVATSYPGLVRGAPGPARVEADVVRLDGAVETAITLGVADVIADVVETGATLRSQGLAVFGEPILRSEAVLIRQPAAAEDNGVGCCAVACSASSPRAPT